MAEVKKIVLALDEETEVELSLTEARALYSSLRVLFGPREWEQPLAAPPQFPVYPQYPFVTWSSTDAS